MAKLFSRDSIVSAFKRRIKPFRIEALDAEVCLKPLSGAARAQLADAHKQMQQGSWTQYETIRDVQWRAVAQGLVDESGKRIYGDDDYERIGQDFDADIIDLIANEIIRISGLTKTAEEVAEIIKNSEPIPNTES